ncbi:mucin-6-like, partial [Drosophila novamexicana]|uniref:mucin-6-like n=1 Tax=Drosophila novamexicana TaxID=47314 RepID=UPI0011E5CAD1
ASVEDSQIPQQIRPEHLDPDPLILPPSPNEPGNRERALINTVQHYNNNTNYSTVSVLPGRHGLTADSQSTTAILPPAATGTPTVHDPDDGVTDRDSSAPQIDEIDHALWSMALPATSSNAGNIIAQTLPSSVAAATPVAQSMLQTGQADAEQTSPAIVPPAAGSTAAADRHTIATTVNSSPSAVSDELATTLDRSPHAVADSPGLAVATLTSPAILPRAAVNAPKAPEHNASFSAPGPLAALMLVTPNTSGRRRKQDINTAPTHKTGTAHTTIEDRCSMETDQAPSVLATLAVNKAPPAVGQQAGQAEAEQTLTAIAPPAAGSTTAADRHTVATIVNSSPSAVSDELASTLDRSPHAVAESPGLSVATLTSPAILPRAAVNAPKAPEHNASFSAPGPLATLISVTPNTSERRRKQDINTAPARKAGTAYTTIEDRCLMETDQAPSVLATLAVNNAPPAVGQQAGQVEAEQTLTAIAQPAAGSTAAADRHTIATIVNSSPSAVSDELASTLDRSPHAVADSPGLAVATLTSPAILPRAAVNAPKAPEHNASFSAPGPLAALMLVTPNTSGRRRKQDINTAPTHKTGTAHTTIEDRCSMETDQAPSVLATLAVNKAPPAVGQQAGQAEAEQTLTAIAPPAAGSTTAADRHTVATIVNSSPSAVSDELASTLDRSPHAVAESPGLSVATLTSPAILPRAAVNAPKAPEHNASFSVPGPLAALISVTPNTSERRRKQDINTAPARKAGTAYTTIEDRCLMETDQAPSVLATLAVNNAPPAVGQQAGQVEAEQTSTAIAQPAAGSTAAADRHTIATIVNSSPSAVSDELASTLVRSPHAVAESPGLAVATLTSPATLPRAAVNAPKAPEHNASFSAPGPLAALTSVTPNTSERRRKQDINTAPTHKTGTAHTTIEDRCSMETDQAPSVIATLAVSKTLPAVGQQAGQAEAEQTLPANAPPAAGSTAAAARHTIVTTVNTSPSAISEERASTLDRSPHAEAESPGLAVATLTKPAILPRAAVNAPRAPEHNASFSAPGPLAALIASVEDSQIPQQIRPEHLDPDPLILPPSPNEPGNRERALINTVQHYNNNTNYSTVSVLPGRHGLTADSQSTTAILPPAATGTPTVHDPDDGVTDRDSSAPQIDEIDHALWSMALPATSSNAGNIIAQTLPSSVAAATPVAQSMLQTGQADAEQTSPAIVPPAAGSTAAADRHTIATTVNSSPSAVSDELATTLDRSPHAVADSPGLAVATLTSPAILPRAAVNAPKAPEHNASFSAPGPLAALMLVTPNTSGRRRKQDINTAPTHKTGTAHTTIEDRCSMETDQAPSVLATLAVNKAPPAVGQQAGQAEAEQTLTAIAPPAAGSTTAADRHTVATIVNSSPSAVSDELASTLDRSPHAVAESPGLSVATLTSPAILPRAAVNAPKAPEHNASFSAPGPLATLISVTPNTSERRRKQDINTAPARKAGTAYTTIEDRCLMETDQAPSVLATLAVNNAPPAVGQQAGQVEAEQTLTAIAQPAAGSTAAADRHTIATIVNSSPSAVSDELASTLDRSPHAVADSPGLAVATLTSPAILPRAAVNAPKAPEHNASFSAPGPLAALMLVTPNTSGRRRKQDINTAPTHKTGTAHTTIEDRCSMETDQAPSVLATLAVNKAPPAVGQQAGQAEAEQTLTAIAPPAAGSTTAADRHTVATIVNSSPSAVSDELASTLDRSPHAVAESPGLSVATLTSPAILPRAAVNAPKAPEHNASFSVPGPLAALISVTPNTSERRRKQDINTAPARKAGTAYTTIEDRCLMETDQAPSVLATLAVNNAPPAVGQQAGQVEAEQTSTAIAQPAAGSTAAADRHTIATIVNSSPSAVSDELASTLVRSPHAVAESPGLAVATLTSPATLPRAAVNAPKAPEHNASFSAPGPLAALISVTPNTSERRRKQDINTAPTHKTGTAHTTIEDRCSMETDQAPSVIATLAVSKTLPAVGQQAGQAEAEQTLPANAPPAAGSTAAAARHTIVTTVNTSPSAISEERASTLDRSPHAEAESPGLAVATLTKPAILPRAAVNAPRAPEHNASFSAPGPLAALMLVTPNTAERRRKQNINNNNNINNNATHQTPGNSALAATSHSAHATTLTTAGSTPSDTSDTEVLEAECCLP